MDYIEKNQLIKTFLGGRFYVRDVDGYKKALSVFHKHELIFHSDWNWLMLLVHEITTEDDFQSDYPHNELFWELFNQIDLKSTFEACVYFIKWKNTQK